MPDLRILTIVQSRMNSTRLPGKVLLDIAGQPMLARVVERARRAKMLDEVVVATTLDPSDEPVEALCKTRNYPIYRGSANEDVLDRYYQAAREYAADIIVRLTADCPLLDPNVLDLTVQALGDRSDFAANRLPPPWSRSLPIGLDVEVCTLAALERAWREAEQPYQREHVLPYISAISLGTCHFRLSYKPINDLPIDYTRPLSPLYGTDRPITVGHESTRERRTPLSAVARHPSVLFVIVDYSVTAVSSRRLVRYSLDSSRKSMSFTYPIG